MNQSRRFLGGEGWEAAAAVKPGDRVLLEGLGWATVRLIDHGYQMLDVDLEAGFPARVKSARVLMVEASPWENAT